MDFAIMWYVYYAEPKEFVWKCAKEAVRWTDHILSCHVAHGWLEKEQFFQK